jgi:LDH2 family malate/lactate/ureidoglycolate dehydrogenase
MLKALRACPPAEGEERVYFAGLPEMEYEQETQKLGIPLVSKTYTMLHGIGEEFGIEVPSAIS